MRKDLEMFAQDTGKYGTYFYASGATLSIDLSSKRRCRSILSMMDLAGKTILDVGCGDGIYTYELTQTKPALVVGIDPIAEVISHAQKKFSDTPSLRFECADLYTMKIPQPLYDVAILRGVLHHLPDLENGIRRACLLAKRIIVLEPNGNNPVLKIIEKTSKYHIEHQEQSFTPRLLQREFAKHGGKVVKEEFINLVPTFCPDFLVRFLKIFEPIIEKIPLLRNIVCGQYCCLIEVRS